MATKNEAVKDILSVATPGEWKDFIFELQTTLIANGYVTLFNEKGQEEFAYKMQGLYNFFTALQATNK